MNNDFGFVPLALMDEYENNSNTHPRDQIDFLKKVILFNGFAAPALVQKKGSRYSLIAGHGRKEAMEELYAEGNVLQTANKTPIPAETMPVVFADGWTKEQIAAYVLADYQSAHMSILDSDRVQLELQALSELDFDLSLTGFELALEDETPTETITPESSAKELDPDNYALDHKCPRCGFEFDD